MTTQPARISHNKRILTASIVMAAIAALLLGAAGVSAANHRERDGRGIACLQLHAGANNLEASLEELVQDGTLTVEQQTAILDQLSEGMNIRARACTGMDLIRDRAVGTAVMELLGMDRAEIRIEWLDGNSLAEMAEAQGVDRETLIDTISTAIDTKLTEAVENGRITEERKAEIEAELTTKIEEAVDLHLSDVVDRLRDSLDATDDSSTPVSTTGLTTIA